MDIRIPEQPHASGSSYQRFSLRRGSALAVAAVAARLVFKGDAIKDARVVLGAVAPVPLMAQNCAGALIGNAFSAELFALAAKLAAKEAQPIADIRGTEDFRRHLVQVLTVKALEEATARARGS